jgi:replication factor A2
LIPLSVKQILGANIDDDTFRVDGAELSTIKLVGMVDQVNEHETNFTFKLSDGSGVIECKQWIEKGANSAPKASKLR